MKRLTEERLSHLCDMMIIHIVYQRHEKAMRIAQFLRQYHGSHLVENLETFTGLRKVHPITLTGPNPETTDELTVDANPLRNWTNK